MALSGTLYAYSGNITLKVIWSAKQSIEGNYSTIKVDTHIVHNTGKIKTNYTGSGNLMYKKTWSIAAYNSTTYSDTNYHDELLNSMEVAIPHNADGTLSGVLSVSIPEVSYWLPGKAEAKTGTLTASGTIILDTIARATTPTLSVSSVEMNSKLVISMPRAASSFKHSLSYAFGNASGTIGDNLDTSYEWTVPLSLASQIPSATAGTLTITCKTYSGSTLIGTKQVTVKATVPASVVPTISNIEVSDPTGNKDKFHYYVKTKSKANVKVTASGAYGSTIKSYKIVANGVTYTQSNITTSELATAGTNTITVTVTDSRGRVISTTTTINVADYTPPTIKELTAVRSDNNYTADPEGEYITIKGNVEVSRINGMNTSSIKLQYRVQGKTDWTPIATASSYGWAVYQKVAADIDSMYEVQLVVTDAFSTAEKTMLVTTVYTIMDFKADGKGIAFGKVSTEEGFDVNMPTRFRKEVIAEQGSYVSDLNGEYWGSEGYVVLARMEITGSYMSSADIEFDILGINQSGKVLFRFNNPSVATDTRVQLFTQDSLLSQMYYTLTVGTDRVTIDLIGQKPKWGNYRIINIRATSHVFDRAIITFPNTFESILRNGAVAATMSTKYVGGVCAINDLIARFGTDQQASLASLWDMVTLFPPYELTDINNPRQGIGLGILGSPGGDSTLYLSFTFCWITIQFAADSVNIYARKYYGNNGWSDWAFIR